MSGEKTTPKSPEYKKTIDTTGFGLTCVTEYGFDNDGLFHHEYAYTHENRKAVIQVTGSRKPADWHTRQSAYASYYEDGRQVGKTRAYNIYENAQIKAVRWVMGMVPTARPMKHAVRCDWRKAAETSGHARESPKRSAWKWMDWPILSA